MDMRKLVGRKRPFTRTELAAAIGCHVLTIDNHRSRGNLAWRKDDGDRRIVLIEADEALRFAKWYQSRSLGAAS